MERSRAENPPASPPGSTTGLEAAPHDEQELQRARELGLPDDDQPMTDEYRRVIREQIAEGMASARAGRFVDGETVFARIKAEMAELERQGQG